jgi:hypothetical protein
MFSFIIFTFGYFARLNCLRSLLTVLRSTPSSLVNTYVQYMLVEEVTLLHLPACCMDMQFLLNAL